MSRYETILPNLFPYYVELPKGDIAEAVKSLTGTRTDVTSFSSFCVTAGVMHPDGKPTLWLSQVSMDFLTRNGNGLPGRVARELRRAKEVMDDIRRRNQHLIEDDHDVEGRSTQQ